MNNLAKQQKTNNYNSSDEPKATTARETTAWKTTPSPLMSLSPTGNHSAATDEVHWQELATELTEFTLYT